MITYGQFKVKHGKIVNFTVFDNYDNRLDYHNNLLELNYIRVKSCEYNELIPFVMKELKKYIPSINFDGIIDF